MATILINIVRLGLSLAFNRSALPESSQAYVFQYGLQQSLQDAHAQVVRKTFPAGPEGDKAWKAAAIARVKARETQIRNGTIGQRVVVMSEAQVAAANAGMTEAEHAQAVAEFVAKKKAGEAPADEGKRKRA